MSHGPLLFNPSRLDREELEATFVGRQELLSRLEADMVADAERHTSRHWLLMGPRGIGKSHFTELLSRRIRDRGWPVVRLPEEHYQVSNVADLLEQIVARLIDGPSPFASESSVHRVEDGAIDWLRQHRRRSSGPILVVLENLGDFLDQLSLRDQQRLRELLMRDAPVVLVASATGPVEATSHHDAPFYDFFHPIVLEDLSREDVKQLVSTRVARENREDVLATKDEILGRVEAMYHFSGGNPRLVLALYDVLRDGVTEALFDQMLRLLDQVTPYYQSRLRDISPQMVRVLTEMSIAEGPLTPSEIAKRTRLATNQVTANITKLVDARLVVATGRPDKRRRYYEVVDRLFRIWIQMREDRSSRQRLRFLTEFYQALYGGRSDDAWATASKVVARFWDDVRSGHAGAARDSIRTIDHMLAALDVQDPVFVFDRLDNVEDIDVERRATDLEAIIRTCDEPEQLPVLACRLVELRDRQGVPERAFPFLERAVVRGPEHTRCSAWFLFLVLATGQRDKMTGKRIMVKMHESMREPNEIRPVARTALLMGRFITVPSEAAKQDPELAAIRALALDDNEAFSVAARRMATRPPLWAQWLVLVASPRGIAAGRLWLSRGYRGAWFLFSAIAGVLHGTLPKTEADEWLDLLAPYVEARLDEVMSLAGTKHRLPIYALFATRFGSAHPPYTAAMGVAQAHDREGALAALHPEEREAVELLLRSAEDADEPT